ncbi:MAG TPA: hypothetical protein VII66_10075 [Gemmatimonadaceae bacterium]
MIVVRFVARIIIVAVACALATTWFGWASLPFVGFIYGVAGQRARADGTSAALGAALGWLGILGAEAARGADVRLVAERMGEVMQIPAFVFVLVTLVFAAMLCGTAARMGAAIVRIATKRADGRPSMNR